MPPVFYWTLSPIRSTALPTPSLALGTTAYVRARVPLDAYGRLVSSCSCSSCSPFSYSSFCSHSSYFFFLLCPILCLVFSSTFFLLTNQTVRSLLSFFPFPSCFFLAVSPPNFYHSCVILRASFHFLSSLLFEFHFPIANLDCFHLTFTFAFSFASISVIVRALTYFFALAFAFAFSCAFAYFMAFTFAYVIV